MARSRAASRIRWTLVVLGFVAVVLVAYTGYQAVRAKENLEQVADDFQTLSGQLTSGDQEAAGATLDQAQEHARTARDNTHGPGWWLTSRIPGVGKNIVAVRTVADVVDNLAQDVLPDVVRATATLKPENLRPVDGRVDLQPISDVAPQVVRADERLSDEAERVRGIDADGLAPQIARPVRLMQTKLAEATTLSDRASRAVRLLPPMLGAEGKRTYLLLFQNNAEVRSTGGIPGSFATVTADHGKVSFGETGDAATIGRFDKPPVQLTSDELQLFNANLGRFPQDVNFTPDFPRSAQLARAMWNARHGEQVDGVISTDPVALSYLLRGTGPVKLGGGRQLGAEDAVRVLLSDVYADIPDPSRQNPFFSAVAQKVFDAVASGQGQPKVVLDNLVKGATERRILVWSARPDEQKIIAPTHLSGALAHSRGDSPQVGVFLNNGGGSKLDYYLDYDVDVVSERCQADRQHMTVTLHLKSQVPKDTSDLPDYVAENVVGIPRGQIRTTLFVYAPVDGFFDGAKLDGEERELSRREHDGRTVVAQTVDLEPGQEHTLTWQMVGGKGQTEQPELRVTPGVHSDGVGSVSASAC